MKFNKPSKKKIIIRAIVFVFTIITITLSIILSRALINKSEEGNIFSKTHITIIIKDIE